MVSLTDSMDREGSLLSWKTIDFKTVGFSFGIRMFSLPPFSIPSKASVHPIYNRNWSMSLKCWLARISMDTVTSSALYAITDRQTSIICEEK